MARIDYGNDLTAPVLQPGWTTSDDGYGLQASRCTFKVDYTADAGIKNSFFYVGAPHPVHTNLFMYKWEHTNDKGKINTVTAEYAGIDPTMSGWSLPQIQMTGSSSAEDISHHPNFIRLNCTSNGLSNVLAGPPPAGAIFDKNPSTNPNRALWAPIVSNQGASNDCQFVGFLPSNSSSASNINIKAGIKSYYKPQSTLRMMFYVQAGSVASSEAMALALSSYVGWTTTGTTFKMPDTYKALANGSYPGCFTYATEYQSKIHRSFLITNCSVERFGFVCKVTMDLMLSGISGWDKDIYPKIDEI